MMTVANVSPMGLVTVDSDLPPHDNIEPELQVPEVEVVECINEHQAAQQSQSGQKKPAPGDDYSDTQTRSDTTEDTSD